MKAPLAEKVEYQGELRKGWLQL